MVFPQQLPLPRCWLNRSIAFHRLLDSKFQVYNSESDLHSLNRITFPQNYINQFRNIKWKQDGRESDTSANVKLQIHCNEVGSRTCLHIFSPVSNKDENKSFLNLLLISQTYSLILSCYDEVFRLLIPKFLQITNILTLKILLQCIRDGQ